MPPQAAWGTVPVPAWQAGSPGSAAPAQYVAPHRGGIVLVLGLLGFIMSCPVFSLIAWVMGSNDLAEMRAGRMDPSGEAMTQAGRLMGMLMSLFYLAIIGLALTIGLFAALAGR
jgi:mannitol-specific phosphotransferase system IIBC component